MRAIQALLAAFIIIIAAITLAVIGLNSRHLAGFVSIIVLLFIINTAYHMWIGMQEIILDYVHDEKWKFLSLMANTFFVFAVSLASVYALLRLSFGV